MLFFITCMEVCVVLLQTSFFCRVSGNKSSGRGQRWSVEQKWGWSMGRVIEEDCRLYSQFRLVNRAGMFRKFMGIS